jgi:hypothetical protein
MDLDETIRKLILREEEFNKLLGQEKDVQKLLELGWKYQGHASLARQIFSRVLDLDAANLDAYCGAAQCSFLMGDDENAKIYVTRGLETTPNDPRLKKMAKEFV